MSQSTCGGQEKTRESQCSLCTMCILENLTQEARHGSKSLFLLSYFPRPLSFSFKQYQSFLLILVLVEKMFVKSPQNYEGKLRSCGNSPHLIFTSVQVCHSHLFIGSHNSQGIFAISLTL